MKITIESTSKMVELVVGVQRARVPARVWQGETDGGVPVQVFVTRIAPEIPPDDSRQADFERELLRQADPRATVEAIPLRLII